MLLNFYSKYTDRIGKVDVDAFSVQQFKNLDVICSSSYVDCSVSVLQYHSIRTWTNLSTTHADRNG